LGKIVRECWDAIPEHFASVALDQFVVMPNHGHGIIVITVPSLAAGHTLSQQTFGNATVGATHASPLQPPRGPKRKALGSIIGSFKSAVTKRMNEIGHASDDKLWQRGYYEHVRRNERDLDRIRQYIVNNPGKWQLDEYFHA
jgi:REP element-mobilizing transposase RayT